MKSEVYHPDLTIREYEIEVRELVWRIDAGSYYALVLATSPTDAAGKAKDLERKGQLGSEFQNIDRVSGPWERTKRQLIAG